MPIKLQKIYDSRWKTMTYTKMVFMRGWQSNCPFNHKPIALDYKFFKGDLHMMESFMSGNSYKIDKKLLPVKCEIVPHKGTPMKVEEVLKKYFCANEPNKTNFFFKTNRFGRYYWFTNCNSKGYLHIHISKNIITHKKLMKKLSDLGVLILDFPKSDSEILAHVFSYELGR